MSPSSTDQSSTRTDRFFAKYEQLCIRFIGFSPLTPDCRDDETMASYSKRVLQTLAKVIVWMLSFNILSLIVLVLSVGTIGFSNPNPFVAGIILIPASLLAGGWGARWIILKIWPKT
jgi:hypothetical protein